MLREGRGSEKERERKIYIYICISIYIYISIDIEVCMYMHYDSSRGAVLSHYTAVRNIRGFSEKQVLNGCSQILEPPFRSSYK